MKECFCNNPYFLQDFQITNIGNKCSLVFLDVFPEDEGRYFCKAVNSAGEATTTCVLMVDGE